MSFIISYRLAAENELAEAVEWYDNQRPGLGKELVAAVRAVLDQVGRQPSFYPAVAHRVHQAIVTKFPYSVIYRVRGNKVMILAVFHSSRDPVIWQKRI
jgi:toxin ParE1/3/4